MLIHHHFYDMVKWLVLPLSKDKTGQCFFMKERLHLHIQSETVVLKLSLSKKLNCKTQKNSSIMTETMVCSQKCRPV